MTPFSDLANPEFTSYSIALSHNQERDRLQNDTINQDLKREREIYTEISEGIEAQKITLSPQTTQVRPGNRQTNSTT